jgi:hypothetical protein
MGIENPLSLLYEQYTNGALTIRELEARIFEYVLKSCDDEYGLYFRCRSERIDFLCWFYPRMQGLIERYKQAYSSFDAYVASTLRYSYRSYKARRKKHAFAENACWNASNSGLVSCDSGIMYDDIETIPVNYEIKSPKYVLLILLKSYYYVSDEMVYKAASAMGMPPEVLGKMIDTLHALQIGKIERVQRLVSAAHCLYYRCLNYERQLAGKIENPQARDLVLQRLEKGRQRLENMRKRLKSMRIEATNSDLAKLLGVPKGTIDSRLALIKSKLAANKLDF